MEYAYTLAHHWWPGPTVEVHNPSGALLATFPLTFIEKTNNNTWRLIADIVDIIVGVEPTLPPILQLNGALVDLDAAPTGGTVIYRPGGTPGSPDVRALASDRANGNKTQGSPSSDCSESSELRLLAKRTPDIQCFASGYTSAICQAAHLVPRARRDVYSSIWGPKFDQSVDNYTTLVMMTPNLHAHYDTLNMSFFPLDVTPDNEVWEIHFFCPPSGGTPVEIAERELHGRIIQVGQPGVDQMYRPDARLAKWHYTQAVRLRFGAASDDESPAPQSPLT